VCWGLHRACCERKPHGGPPGLGTEHAVRSSYQLLLCRGGLPSSGTYSPAVSSGVERTAPGGVQRNSMTAPSTPAAERRPDDPERITADRQRTGAS
jgi:hypothetical protein